MYDLKGKTGVVTGGAGGIGACCVRELLKNGMAKVIIFDVNSRLGEDTAKKMCTEFGKGRCSFVTCDVTKMADFEKKFRATCPCDLLINNAGVLCENDVDRTIAINMNGVVYGTTLAMRYMGKNSGGSGGTCVNMASILGLAPLAGCPVYAGTKHAVVGMTRSWAMPFHHERTGVRMLCLCPGVTDTDLISDERQRSGDVGAECHRALRAMPKQTPEAVALGMMHMLQHGKNGSTWVCEGGEPVYRVEIPDRERMRV